VSPVWPPPIVAATGSNRACSGEPGHFLWRRLGGAPVQPAQWASESRNLPNRVAPAVGALEDWNRPSHVHDWVRLELEERSPGRGGFGQGFD